MSLWLTHVDILGLETRLPDVEKIKHVQFAGREFTEREDIDNLLRLHADALEHRADNSGTYVQVDGEWIRYIDTNSDRIDEENPDNRYTYVDSLTLTYEMESGKLIKRRYNIWMDTKYVDSEAGRISESYLTQWDTVNSRVITIAGVEHKRLDLILENPKAFYVDYMEPGDWQEDLATKENIRSLVAALQADCAAGNMAQNYIYHSGSFRYEDEYSETGYSQTSEIGISISGEKYSWWVSVYPDSAHTLKWLQDHGLLAAEVTDEDLLW